MKFLANENLERRIVSFLRESGYDVKYCAEISPAINDEEVLQIANQEERIIVTNDKDFGELTFLQHKTKVGILLLRFEIEDTLHKISILDEVIKEYKDKITNHFTVVSEKKIRIRPLL